ncbi:hypothetical protein DUI87_00062 [Hirundo rustica rustica]|uniref:Uncharacterized protein n=1 Tax=Hirundo rustica rustica TaxID=333673 RepID=A0A3M0LC03_HIRRU|nr:hypothetical protein DUI87_00062 [Hirundo rustica rustica]
MPRFLEGKVGMKGLLRQKSQGLREKQELGCARLESEGQKEDLEQAELKIPTFLREKWEGVLVLWRDPQHDDDDDEGDDNNDDGSEDEDDNDDDEGDDDVNDDNEE